MGSGLESATGGGARSNPKLIAFPRRANDYCEQLYAAVAELGVEAVDGRWSGRWIYENVREGDLVHIHWPSFLYFRSELQQARSEHSLLAEYVVRPLDSLICFVRFFALISLIRMLGGRIAWTAHNLYPHDGGRNRWRHRLARRFIARVAHVIFVHGAAAASLVSAEFGVDVGKMRRVPHGHWRDRYPHVPTRAQARARVGLPADAAVFGFAASCRPYKNVESIVDAHRELDSASHLLIAGTFLPPEYLDTVRSRIDPVCADRVHIVPRFLDAEELMAYVAALDVYVLSYKEILTSGAVMLAFSAGVPVVAPRIGGLPELIDARVGVLYDASVPGDLARALREVRQRTYSAETIIAHALSFDWRVSARALVDVVMGGAREPHATSVLQAKGAESKR